MPYTELKEDAKPRHGDIDLPPMRHELPEWNALVDHARFIEKTHIRDFFAQDQNRFDRFSLNCDSLLMDYSKQRVNTETIEKLCSYARACHIEKWRDKMFTGDIVNTTEDRSVLHTALRARENEAVFLDGVNVVPDVHNTLNRMKAFSEKIRKEGRFTRIVNIGIGGSDLGGVMAYQALKNFSDRNIKVHFVSNVDFSHLSEVLRKADPEKTLFIVASKTFTTMETMTNANSARKWMQDALQKDDVSDHFIAISSNVDLARAQDFRDDCIFPLWQWVGGRFSLWSTIGLPLVIALGYERFRQMLDGAKIMDEHFRHTPLEQNIPVILGLIGMWNRNFMGYDTLGVVPYNQSLHRFPAYLQQLDMESNGKSVDRQGRPLPYDSGPIVFGEPGTNAQHAFFQLVHQGTSVVPCEFIACFRGQDESRHDHHIKLLASVFAQSKAMMEGQDSDDPNTFFEGNRPSTTILLHSLTPYNLGMLIALYEHKIFVQGILWNINSFDQCGVELGKGLARQIIPSLSSLNDAPECAAVDTSTQNLIEIAKKMS
ncbi:MAG: glucose-6-phosphate isomerase [Alphaproteobacteria bacterium]